MKLVERDYTILKEVWRFRWCLGRHIRVLADFAGVRACDRRLKILIENEYLKRKHVLYGVPGLYLLTSKAKKLLSVPQREEKIRVEQILHGISLLDTVIYFTKKEYVQLKDIQLEKQLQSQDGFGGRKHFPDFIFTDGSKTNCVEIEIAQKSRARLNTIVQDNYTNYDRQYWIVPNTAYRNLEILKQNQGIYPNIEIIPLEEVNAYVGSIK